MTTRNLMMPLLALTLAGCATVTVLDDASKWTIELASAETSPSGPCRIYDDLNRLMLEGTLASGKMDGTWTSFGSNGDRLAVWSYRDGVRNGPIEMWYGPFAYPEARGHRKLEGAFVNGDYDGVVTRYHPSGTRRCVRVYDHGTLRSARLWSPDGVEQPAAWAQKEAADELNSDLSYLAGLEDMVARSLAHAHRKVRE